MHLKRLELNGFKSFAKKSEFIFDVPIIAIVGPNGSGKSNVVEAIRFVLGEQSVKSMRGKTGSDLIFKGSKDISRMSRASVTIVFDNTDRVFHLHHHNNAKISVDFDEVVITREVFADGGNKYMINGHEVRMKDIHELISSVNIGASGHHIISQGEADRYLNANVKDRRELIEEALGLKVYQYRLKESQRKLNKAESNMKESEMLRREIAPHLRFLKRQVDKIEKAKNLRTQLSDLYLSYFAREDFLIKKISSSIESEKQDIANQFQAIQSILSQQQNPETFISYPEEKELQEKKIYIQNWQEKISENTRELGKIEGMLSLLEKQEQAQKEKQTETKKHPGFSYNQVDQLSQKIVQILDTLTTTNIMFVVQEIKKYMNELMHHKTQREPLQDVIDHSDDIAELARKKKVLVEATTEAESYILDLQKEIQKIEVKLHEKRSHERELQRQYYEHLARKKELQGKQELLAARVNALNKRILDRNEEYQEAIVLLGESTIQYQQIVIDDESITTTNQEQHRRDLERIKIRLEDIGGGSGVEVIKEYEETTERDKFLEREIQDIQTSIQSLESIISDLKKTLDGEFNTGIEKINKQFDIFFKLMFGGGSAKLEPSLVKKRRRKQEEGQMMLMSEDEQEKEYGIDIKVQLPRKKVSDLDMLSGGERSLTSIALLFALSQVNPPPFLVLDETDAALDEANSQKYGNMIESLAEFSQLMVVTHNRETMSRAQTLFGVTLGRDDSSTMLSLRLEDAAKYAK